MNVLAYRFALGAALLTIFQPMSMPILPSIKGSLFNLLLMALRTSSFTRDIISLGSGNFYWYFLALGFGLAGLGIWGGRRALKKQGGTAPLAINAAIFLAIFGLSLMMAGRTHMLFWEFGLWGGLYLTAAVCAGKSEKEVAEASGISSASSDSLSASAQLSESRPISVQEIEVDFKTEKIESQTSDMAPTWASGDAQAEQVTGNSAQNMSPPSQVSALDTPDTSLYAAAAILAFLAAALTTFQNVFEFPILGGVTVWRAARELFDSGILKDGGVQLTASLPIACVIGSLIFGLRGASLAWKQAKKPGARQLLSAAAGLSALFYFSTNFIISKIIYGSMRSMFGGPMGRGGRGGFPMGDFPLTQIARQLFSLTYAPLFWAALYGIAALLIPKSQKDFEGLGDTRWEEGKPSSQMTNIMPAGASSALQMNQDAGQPLETFAQNAYEPTVPPGPAQPASVSYAPILGLETEALVKMAFLLLREGDFYQAGRHVEQALAQDPQNGQAYLGKLMAQLGFRGEEELANSPAPLDEHPLFQSALQFGPEEQRTRLMGLAQAWRARTQALAPTAPKAIASDASALHGQPDAKRNRLILAGGAAALLIALAGVGTKVYLDRRAQEHAAQVEAMRQEQQRARDEAARQEQQRAQAEAARREQQRAQKEREESEKRRRQEEARRKRDEAPRYAETPSMPIDDMRNLDTPYPGRDLGAVPRAIRGNRVNLRSEPSTDSRVLRQMNDGFPVTALRRSADDEWVQVRTSDGTVGWVFGDYIRQHKPSDTVKQRKSVTPRDHGGIPAAIRGNRVNIRKGPSLKDRVLFQLNDGNPVEATRKATAPDGGLWFHIYTPSGKSGWVFGAYIRKR